MSREWFRLDGQVALITGAAQGIGRAVAEALAEAGIVALTSQLAKDLGLSAFG